MVRILKITIFLMAGFIASIPARADITENQALYFGEWVITDNDGVHSITVNTDGSYGNSPELIVITPPEEGIYDVDGLPPNAVINGVTVLMTDPLRLGGGETFSMDNFDTIAPDADPAGETTVTLGARARTSGNGAGYADGRYNGTLTIELHY